MVCTMDVPIAQGKLLRQANTTCQELAGILKDAMTLMKQLESGTTVDSEWIVKRDTLIAEAQLAIPH
jgi:hypothetical protein